MTPAFAARWGRGAGVDTLARAVGEPASRPVRRWDEGDFAVAAGGAGSGGTEQTLCVLDGRITNLAELGRELGLAPGDPERVLAAGHERWGESVLQRCAGEFALLLWDRRGGHGLVARDRLGHRGVFVCDRGHGVLVATEVRELLALLPRRPGPDAVAVAHWLARSGTPDGRTLYEGVQRLGPGQLIRLGPGGQSRRPFWRPAAAAVPVADLAEAVRLLGDAMDAAVARATVGARAPGVMLSGGLDSSSVAGLATRQAATAGRAAPGAYSGVFPEHPEIDESRAIAATRTALGLTGGVHAVRGGSALGTALEFLDAHGLPMTAPNAFAWRPLLRRAAAEGADVVLDGEGGDELLGCAPFLVADALRRGHGLRALRLVRRLPGMGARPEARWLARGVAEYGLRGALGHDRHARLRAARAIPSEPSWLRPELAELHRQSHDPWAWKRLGGPRWAAWLTHAVVDAPDASGAPDELRRESALCGVAFAHPLRDPQLLEAVLRLDPALGFHPRLDRPLARRAMAGVVVDQVRLAERKPMYNALLEQALRGPDAAPAAALLGSGKPACGAYVRLEGVRSLITDRSRRAPLDLWRILGLETWLRAQEDPAATERLRHAVATCEPAARRVH